MKSSRVHLSSWLKPLIDRPGKITEPKSCILSKILALLPCLSWHRFAPILSQIRISKFKYISSSCILRMHESATSLWKDKYFKSFYYLYDTSFLCWKLPACQDSIWPNFAWVGADKEAPQRISLWAFLLWTALSLKFLNNKVLFFFIYFTEHFIFLRDKVKLCHIFFTPMNCSQWSVTTQFFSSFDLDVLESPVEHRGFSRNISVVALQFPVPKILKRQDCQILLQERHAYSKRNKEQVLGRSFLSILFRSDHTLVK